MGLKGDDEMMRATCVRHEELIQLERSKLEAQYELEKVERRLREIKGKERQMGDYKEQLKQEEQDNVVQKRGGEGLDNTVTEEECMFSMSNRLNTASNTVNNLIDLTIRTSTPNPIRRGYKRGTGYNVYPHTLLRQKKMSTPNPQTR
ncbi:hypothetical protein AMECASPLE_016143 [Ameca splendens]|uniref:Uncharacterized protein n=1 Tax=Ameca splendens TaxID=208324 RepID=A0ABV1A8I1_9TELE